MKITVNGKITAAFELRKGVSKNGRDWAMQDYAILPDGEDEIVVFQVLGENNINNYGLKVGAQVSVTLEVKSREYNGKYYPSITAVQCYSQASSEPIVPSTSHPVSQDDSAEENSSSLPF